MPASFGNVSYETMSRTTWRALTCLEYAQHMNKWTSKVMAAVV